VRIVEKGRLPHNTFFNEDVRLPFWAKALLAPLHTGSDKVAISSDKVLISVDKMERGERKILRHH
jgi:hypothetical protein